VGQTIPAAGGYGRNVVESVVCVHDFHAVTLHLLGLTYRPAGRDLRPADSHDRVVRELLASRTGRDVAERCP
jgi:hypothetical protein